MTTSQVLSKILENFLFKSVYIDHSKHSKILS